MTNPSTAMEIINFFINHNDKTVSTDTTDDGQIRLSCDCDEVLIELATAKQLATNIRNLVVVDRGLEPIADEFDRLIAEIETGEVIKFEGELSE